VLFGQPALFGKGSFPATLQFTRNQAVLRLDGLILPSRTLRLVADTLELLLPVLVHTPPLLGYVRGRREVQFQGRRLEDAEDWSRSQGIQASPRQAVTERLAVAEASPDATVA